ncbi:N-acetyltransferase [Streptomyces sp. MUM 203J]|uniref:GNAT family N-acetyltransferase n=1 Tax=Streptomyces sp. MUM 203J TaxID=2791990 RepID=UPI001F0333F3|nr:GNAT family N-acetyltransferase [Streptomyces sp. MUM 203J]
MANGDAGRASHLSARPYQATDETAVLALIEADRRPGQPRTTPAMLAEALVGRSTVDAGWWSELEAPATDVACDAVGRVEGVVSHATRPSDGAGYILWLHSREDLAVAEALVAHALDRLGPRTVYAFEFASALSLGLEGLPVRHRPATRKALEPFGFTGRDLWRYMRAPLPLAGLERTTVHALVTDSEDPPGKRLEIHEDGDLVAEAMIGRPVSGVGVLWWISVTPGSQRRGLGMSLLGSALDQLRELGAKEVILYVDDDAPGDPKRSRAAATRMYDRAGFTEVDRLFSYTRQP